MNTALMNLFYLADYAANPSPYSYKRAKQRFAKYGRNPFNPYKVLPACLVLLAGVAYFMYSLNKSDVLGIPILFLSVLASIFFMACCGTGPILKRFGLKGSDYYLISSEASKQHHRMMNALDGLSAEPIWYFSTKNTLDNIYGLEFKRKLGGGVRYYEFYYAIMVLGLARKLKDAWNVRVLIAYSDTVVEVNYDDRVFNELMSLAPKFNQVHFKDVSGGFDFLLGKSPLQEKMDVTEANPALTLID